MKTKEDFAVIMDLIERYFNGLHRADGAELQKIFHADCYLKAPGVRRSRDEWLTLVAQREVPEQRGDAYDYRIISIEVNNQQAMAKLAVPLLDVLYIDYLGLLKEHEQWLIVNKMYCQV